MKDSERFFYYLILQNPQQFLQLIKAPWGVSVQQNAQYCVVFQIQGWSEASISNCPFQDLAGCFLKETFQQGRNELWAPLKVILRQFLQSKSLFNWDRFCCAYVTQSYFFPFTRWQQEDVYKDSQNSFFNTASSFQLFSCLNGCL